MTRGRAACALVALVGGAVLVLVTAPPQAQPASASAPHRAAVVVDLGDGQVKVGCVSFSEDHISGLEALDRASMAPVAQTYGGQGSAVCALCGKGCSAGSTCLTCKAPNYWAYYHDGRYSPAGAGQAQVRDGDIEGWKWGKGEGPASVPFDQVCPVSAGPAPTPSPPASGVSPVDPVGPPSQPRSIGPAPPSAGRGDGASNGRGTVASTGPPVAGTPPGTAGRAAPTSNLPMSATSVPSTASSPSRTTAPQSSVPATGSAAGKRSTAHERGTAIGRRHIVVERAQDSRRTSSVAADEKSDTSLWSIAAFVGAIAVVVGLIVFIRRRRAPAG